MKFKLNGNMVLNKDQIEDKIYNGNFYGSLDCSTRPIDLAKISHRITDIDWDACTAQYECANTPYGEILKTKILDYTNVSFAVRGLCDPINKTLYITSFDIVPNKEI